MRADILRLGSLLGWDARMVARFAAAVTGQPWCRCGRAELEGVLEAYAALASRVRAAQAGQPGTHHPDRSMP